jgi:hypothetical protein
MGAICSQHLPLRVRIYASNAENGEVTVKPVIFEPGTKVLQCEYCQSPSEFIVSYYPKE